MTRPLLDLLTAMSLLLSMAVVALMVRSHRIADGVWVEGPRWRVDRQRVDLRGTSVSSRLVIEPAVSYVVRINYTPLTPGQAQRLPGAVPRMSTLRHDQSGAVQGLPRRELHPRHFPLLLPPSGQFPWPPFPCYIVRTGSDR